MPELIMAIVILGTTVAAAGAATLLGARWTERAILHQEAVRAGIERLDSLMAMSAPAPGADSTDTIRLRWEVGEDGLIVWVGLVGQTSPVAVLSGRVRDEPPSLPDTP